MSRKPGFCLSPLGKKKKRLGTLPLLDPQGRTPSKSGSSKAEVDQFLQQPRLELRKPDNRMRTQESPRSPSTANIPGMARLLVIGGQGAYNLVGRIGKKTTQ